MPLSLIVFHVKGIKISRRLIESSFQKSTVVCFIVDVYFLSLRIDFSIPRKTSFQRTPSNVTKITFGSCANSVVESKRISEKSFDFMFCSFV